MWKGPFVRKQPRKRNKDGTWRKKRSDAGKKREMSKTITIDRAYFERLLDCLARQKGNRPDANGIYVGKDDVIQEHIDNTLKEGIDLLKAEVGDKDE
jgi:hypothetical protein